MPHDFDAIIALLSAVALASLLGSLHCAGMCGGLALFVVGADGAPRRSRTLHIAYHAGRGISYSIVGLIAGSIGAAIDLSGSYAGFQRPAAVIAGGFMILFGVATLAAMLGARVGARRWVPKRYRDLLAKGHRLAFALKPVPRAWMVGLLTPLLPCGWLYAFAIVAAGTGHPLLGAATMAVFWLGTLPVMVSVAAGLQMLTGPLRRRLPVLTSVLIIGAGAYTVMGRVSLPTFDSPAMATDASPLERVRAAEQSPPPCCALGGKAEGS